jgi:hypothetical protein
MTEKTIFDLIGDDGDWKNTTVPADDMLEVLDGAPIGIVRLTNDETLGIEISGGEICRVVGESRQVIAAIPGLEIFASPETLQTHLNQTFGPIRGRVQSLETTSQPYPPPEAIIGIATGLRNQRTRDAKAAQKR